MRQELITYFKGLKLKGFNVSEELPFVSGTELYIKNPKTVYTDLTQYTNEQIIAVLGNHGVFQEVQTVSVYLTTDAKNLPQGYDQAVTLIRQGKNVDSAQAFFKREVDINTEYQGDLLVTTFEFRFTKIT